MGVGEGKLYYNQTLDFFKKSYFYVKTLKYLKNQFKKNKYFYNFVITTSKISQ